MVCVWGGGVMDPYPPRLDAPGPVLRRVLSDAKEPGKPLEQK